MVIFLTLSPAVANNNILINLLSESLATHRANDAVKCGLCLILSLPSVELVTSYHLAFIFLLSVAEVKVLRLNVNLQHSKATVPNKQNLSLP
jgi:hypothetical protein